MTTEDLDPNTPRAPSAAATARQVEVNDYRWLMSTKQGRRIAHRLLARTGLYQTSFTGNSETFFREGKRSVGLELTSDLMKHAPDDYLAMLKEGMTR